MPLGVRGAQVSKSTHHDHRLNTAERATAGQRRQTARAQHILPTTYSFHWSYLKESRGDARARKFSGSVIFAEKGGCRTSRGALNSLRRGSSRRSCSRRTRSSRPSFRTGSSAASSRRGSPTRICSAAATRARNESATRRLRSTIARGKTTTQCAWLISLYTRGDTSIFLERYFVTASQNLCQAMLLYTCIDTRVVCKE